MNRLQAEKVSSEPTDKPGTSKLLKPKFPARADIELTYERFIKDGYSELAAIEKAFAEVANSCSVAFCAQALSTMIGDGLPIIEAIRGLYVVSAIKESD